MIIPSYKFLIRDNIITKILKSNTNCVNGMIFNMNDKSKTIHTKKNTI